MLNASTFRDIVGGKRTGATAALLRGFLRIGELGYAAAIRLRNKAYDLGLKKTHRVGVPIVSVGNLTLGGTGKTPMVRWLAEWFKKQGIHAAVVSRGYGAAAGEANDEALEMRLLLPDVPHLQNPDRVAAAREAISKHDCRLVVLDDGFQHRRIARDLDIVLLDASAPFGYGHVFPRGMLREPISGLRRADAVILSRADLIAPDEREAIWQIVRRHAPKAIRAEAIHAPTKGVRNLLGCSKGVGSLFTSGATAGLSSSVGDICLNNTAGQASSGTHIQQSNNSVAAFCGIGNPAGFRHTVEQCGCTIVDFREFPDHHRYTPDDLKSLARWADGLDVSAVLCTCKDFVKINRDRLGGKPLSAVRIEMEFLDGREALESLLKKLL